MKIKNQYCANKSTTISPLLKNKVTKMKSKKESEQAQIYILKNSSGFPTIVLLWPFWSLNQETSAAESLPLVSDVCRCILASLFASSSITFRQRNWRTNFFAQEIEGQLLSQAPHKRRQEIQVGFIL